MAQKDGYIKDMKAEYIGKSACVLGAGRVKKEDNIDLSAGIMLYKKVGDYTNENEVIATLYTNDNSKLQEAEKIAQQAITITDNKVEKPKMILS